MARTKRDDEVCGCLPKAKFNPLRVAFGRITQDVRLGIAEMGADMVVYGEARGRSIYRKFSDASEARDYFNHLAGI